MRIPGENFENRFENFLDSSPMNFVKQFPVGFFQGWEDNQVHSLVDKQKSGTS